MTHTISQQKLDQLVLQRSEYEKKFDLKTEQIHTIQESTVDFLEDPTYLSLIERRDFYERKLQQINEVLENYELVKKNNNSLVAGIGSRVKIVNHTHEHEFILVDEAEADPAFSKISQDSPIGRNVFGKTLNDEFEVETPSGAVAYKVMSINYAF